MRGLFYCFQAQGLRGIGCEAKKDITHGLDWNTYANPKALTLPALNPKKPKPKSLTAKLTYPKCQPRANCCKLGAPQGVKGFRVLDLAGLSKSRFDGLEV